MTKILISVLSLAIAGAVFFVYTKPTYDSMSALKTQVAEYDAGLTKSRELQELRSSLLARYNTFSADDLDHLTKLLPDHVDNVRLVLDLDSMATHYGIAVQNVLINAKKAQQTAAAIGALTEEQKKYDSLTLQFSTRATYGNFMSFLQDLESSLRIVDLVSLSIEPDQPTVDSHGNIVTTGEPNYRFNVTLRTYWLK